MKESTRKDRTRIRKQLKSKSALLRGLTFWVKFGRQLKTNL